MIRVANVLCGIVVAVAHREDCSFGQKDRLSISIDRLPVDIPIFDPDQPLLRAIRKRSKSLKVFTQIMSMWVNGEHVDVDGQLEFVCYHEVFLSGWNVERAVAFKLQEHRKACRRLIGK